MRVDFIQDYDISKLTPADYNPRHLEEDKFIKLQESLRKFGIIKPLIVNGDNGILTAGHQRTRAIKAVGFKTAPVIRIKGIKIQDEIRFNLFHNSIETNKTKVRLNGLDKSVGYKTIQPKDIEFSEVKNGGVISDICTLIVRYGEWGSVVADQDGNVILNSDYAVAAKQTNTEMICYVIENEKVKELMSYLEIDYGEYYYETLGIKSYNQLYCQMNRLGKGAKKANASTTYEGYVLPYISGKDLRILDFGAGKCAYVNMLKKQGKRAFAYEPNFQNGKNNIDMKAVVSMIKDIERDVKANGLYDVVVLDSVLNSVVNDEIENMVVMVCNSFLKTDGVFITGTRNKDQRMGVMNAAVAKQKNRNCEFLDKKNFSATFRNGVWTMQHFHTFETLGALMGKYFEDVQLGGNKTSTNIYAVCKRPRTLDLEELEKALEFELNMEYPNKYKHNRHLGLKKLILEGVKKRNEN